MQVTWRVISVEFALDHIKTYQVIPEGIWHFEYTSLFGRFCIVTICYYTCHLAVLVVLCFTSCCFMLALAVPHLSRLKMQISSDRSTALSCFQPAGVSLLYYDPCFTATLAKPPPPAAPYAGSHLSAAVDGTAWQFQNWRNCTCVQPLNESWESRKGSGIQRKNGMTKEQRKGLNRAGFLNVIGLSAFFLKDVTKVSSVQVRVYMGWKLAPI